MMFLVIFVVFQVLASILVFRKFLISLFCGPSLRCPLLHFEDLLGGKENTMFGIRRNQLVQCFNQRVLHKKQGVDA